MFDNFSMILCFLINFYKLKMFASKITSQWKQQLQRAFAWFHPCHRWPSRWYFQSLLDEWRILLVSYILWNAWWMDRKHHFFQRQEGSHWLTSPFWMQCQLIQCSFINLGLRLGCLLTKLSMILSRMMHRVA